jgi:hypothetical protein
MLLSTAVSNRIIGDKLKAGFREYEINDNVRHIGLYETGWLYKLGHSLGDFAGRLGFGKGVSRYHIHLDEMRMAIRRI